MNPQSTLPRKALNIATLAVFLLSLLGAPTFTRADSDPTITGGATLSGLYNVALPVTDIRINGTGNPIVPIRLTVGSGSLVMTTTTGLTFTGSPAGSLVQFRGTLSDDNAALATLTYTRGSIGSDTLRATIIEPGINYDSDNGHVYLVVSTVDDWATAKAAADATSFKGAGGYLVTLTSAAESAFVVPLLTSDAWMGSSDAAVEGEWRWVDGPENSTQFWSGNNSGSTVGGQYANWNPSEPNNSGGNENCGEFQYGSGGVWNDFGCALTQPAYVVEYGAPGQLPAISTVTDSITTSYPTKTISSCSDLQNFNEAADQLDTVVLTNDIDCTGVDYQVPFSSGTTYKGTFDGAYHTITGLTANHSADNFVGFLGKVQGATIKNVTFDGGSLTGSSDVGIIGTAISTVTMHNVHTNLIVSGSQQDVGGLIGYLHPTVRGSTSVIEYCSNTGTVTGSVNTGGLIGWVLDDGGSSTMIRKDFSTGNISSTDVNTGGLVGKVSYASHFVGLVTIQDSYTSGSVSSSSQHVGGLIGSGDTLSPNAGLEILTVQRSYSSGAVRGSDYVGGLFGSAALDPIRLSHFNLADTFTTSAVTATADSPSFFGGVVGDYETGAVAITPNNNYYDQTQTLMASDAGGNALSGVTAVNTDGTDGSRYKNNSSNAPLNSWDFSTIWNINADTYPTLIAIIPPPAPTPTPTPSQTPTPTPTITPDADSDGISTTIENAAPNGGDANNDGTVDSTEANVASYINPVTGQYVSVQLNSSCSISATNVAAASEKPVKDVAFSYPAGLLNYTASCGTSGYTATVTLYYYGVDSSKLVARKYDARNQSYSALPSATISQVTIAGQSVAKLVYQITDGGALDEDGAANGVIVDPVGLALSTFGIPNTGLGGSQNRE